MTDMTQVPTTPGGGSLNSDEPNDVTAASPELAPLAKITRARATTSEAPKPRPKAATSRSELTTAGVSSENGASGRPANVSIYQGGADQVQGDSVSITQGGATNVEAGRVEVRQGGIANARADEIKVTMGGVGLARADRVNVEMGGLGISFSREAHVTQGVARSVIAQDVRVEQGLVGTAIAGHVTFEHPSPVFLLVAGRTDGAVRAMFDWRGALAFGALFGIVVGVLRRR